MSKKTDMNTPELQFSFEGRPHRDIDDVVSVSVRVSVGDISLLAFVRLNEKVRSLSYIELPQTVEFDPNSTQSVIAASWNWIEGKEIEDLR